MPTVVDIRISFGGANLIAHLHLVRDVPSGHGSPIFWWLRATPVIVSWFAGRTWKNNISDIRNCLTYCVGFIVHTRFLNVTAVPVIQPGGPQVGDPCFRACTVTI
jgi:hypothetical protein